MLGQRAVEQSRELPHTHPAGSVHEVPPLTMIPEGEGLELSRICSSPMIHTTTTPSDCRAHSDAGTGTNSELSNENDIYSVHVVQGRLA